MYFRRYDLGGKDSVDATAFAYAEKKNPITNADRIRAMTDEELAKYICKTQYREGDVCPPTHNCAVDKSCENCWLDWLKQEARE